MKTKIEVNKRAQALKIFSAHHNDELFLKITDIE